MSRFLRDWSVLAVTAGLSLLIGVPQARAEQNFCRVVSCSDIPEAAVQQGGEALEEFGLLILDLGDGLYVATELAGPVYQAMFLVGSNGVILVDAPPTLMSLSSPVPLRTDLLGAIDQIAEGKPIKRLVYSHIHVDHIGGAGDVVAAFPNVKIHAHKDAGRELEAANDPRRPVPTRTFRHEKTITTGGAVLELSHTTNFHSLGDLFIYAPEQDTLMLVDVVFPNWVPFSGLGLTKNVREFIQVHQDILDFPKPVEHFVGGHLTRIGDLSDVARAQEYVAAVQAAAGTALFELGVGDPANEFDGFPFEYFQFGPSPFNVFDHFLEDVSNRCEQLLVDPAEGHPFGNFEDLGGLAVFTKSHCFAMQNFLRLE